MLQCDACKDNMVVTEYGTKVCRCCGVESFDSILSQDLCVHNYAVPIHTTSTYTRLKRFKKYLNRATMNQSQTSVPEATWDYLLQKAPYKGPSQIVKRLKKAPKSIKKKCYDCLPFLSHTLCPHLSVPTLSEFEKRRALQLFLILDRAYQSGEAFVSYLFALEYILCILNRRDILPFLNKISCSKRRCAYTRRLNRIFSKTNQ